MLSIPRQISLLFILFFSVTLKAQAVFKTPSGAKYHLASCRMVKNVSEEITINQAEKAGLQPCRICHPQTSEALMAPAVHKAQGQSNTTQCRGLTKAGSRCRHMTSIANGFCYQHQNR